ncbi:MAG: hypothetical protein NT070_15900 [Cyanobacteria bacterium]|nr:hypothetical protein [Cyanobacteriota bacterium]
MNLSESRRSEKIREYFNLLRWFNDLKLARSSSSQDILDSDTVAANIKKSVEYLNNSKISLDIEFQKLYKKVESISHELNHIHSAISKNNVEIDLLEAHILIKESKYVNFDRKDTSVSPVKSSHKTIFSLLLDDIKRSNVFNKMHVLNTLPKVVGVSILLFLFLLSLKFVNNISYQIITFSYFLLLSTLIFILIELIVKYFVSKSRKIEGLNSSRNMKEDLRNPYNSEIIADRKLHQALKYEQENLQYRNDQMTEEYKTINSELKNIQAKLNEIESSIDSKKSEYCEKEKYIDSKLQRLIILEEYVENLLKNDISLLPGKAMKYLNIEYEDETNITKLNVLKRLPFPMAIGISRTERGKLNKRINSGENASLLVESDNDRSLKSVEKTNLSIDENDFYCATKYSSSTNAFGVYEFVVIFLCSNFLTYYRCYFNFVQGQPIDEEYCEYLYDSVVSVKVQEKSRIGDDSSRKSIYRRRLLITTTDAKIICFRFPQHRITSAVSGKSSDIDGAATAIREMLRQRRIDILATSEQGDC